MIDQVELLEQHVETLLTLLESSKLKVVELKRENEGLQQQIDQMSEVALHNEQLQGQVQQLEAEMEGMASKETQIRERLRTILSKIDSIENELTSAGSAD
jgi:DNA repair exonuclease SbcCD ATPase subunit